MTTIMKCSCTNEQQDIIYGEKKRVFNRMAKMSGTQYSYRCTVCGMEKSKGDTDIKSKKKK